MWSHRRAPATKRAAAFCSNGCGYQPRQLRVSCNSPSNNSQMLELTHVLPQLSVNDEWCAADVIGRSRIGKPTRCGRLWSADHRRRPADWLQLVQCPPATSTLQLAVTAGRRQTWTADDAFQATVAVSSRHSISICCGPSSDPDAERIQPDELRRAESHPLEH